MYKIINLFARVFIAYQYTFSGNKAIYTLCLQNFQEKMALRFKSYTSLWLYLGFYIVLKINGDTSVLSPPKNDAFKLPGNYSKGKRVFIYLGF